MVAPHEWYECRPAMLKLNGPGDPVDAQIMNAAIERAWAQLSDNDRKAFHRFCCYNARDLETVRTVGRFAGAIRAGVPERLR